MKKMFALLTAMACLFSLLVMPAAAAETDILDEKFQQLLDGLDFGYETYGSLAAYMIVKSNRTIFEDLFEDPWEHMGEVLIIYAKDYEEVISRNFVPSAQDMDEIRNVGYGDILVYDAEEKTYTIKYPGGFGGALSQRAYLGYEANVGGFDVYYGKANYVFLADVLPEGMDEQTYAESQGNPVFLEYDGKLYENGPDGYYYLDSIGLSGMKYSLVSDGLNIRISGAQTFTEEECPENLKNETEPEDPTEPEEPTEPEDPTEPEEPAVPGEGTTDILDGQFREALTWIDVTYDQRNSLRPYMIEKTNNVILAENGWKKTDVSVEEYESILNQYFATTAGDIEYIRWEGPKYGVSYNYSQGTYTVAYGSEGGILLPKRQYMGYQTTSQGFDVYYGDAEYIFLKDILPEGTSESDYVVEGQPEHAFYDGQWYQYLSTEGFARWEFSKKTGMKYSVEFNGDIVRILSANAFSAEECPDSFEKLPEVDEDLLSIMEDIEALVNKYGPEIPDDVKNGTAEGTTCHYTPGDQSYYVAIGDDTTLVTESYVKLLAESLGIPYKDLPEKKDDKKGMLIDAADAAFLEANRAELEKADLISVGFSINGFASVAVEEVLKNKSEEDSYLNWGRYLPTEGVREIESILQRMEEYLENTGMTGKIPILDIPKTDALVVAAESFAFGTLAYINELPRLIEDIRKINPTAQIIIVGMDNPMEDSSITLSNGEKMELGIFVDQLINNMDDVAQTIAIENENTVFVSAPDAANANDGQELSENALILSYINGVKDKAKPNAEGQAYICGQILNAMRQKGDVDGDGLVTYNDALLVLRASIGLDTLAPELLSFADVDGDGEPSYNDALMILRASIGLDTLG